LNQCIKIKKSHLSAVKNSNNFFLFRVGW